MSPLGRRATQLHEVVLVLAARLLDVPRTQVERVLGARLRAARAQHQLTADETSWVRAEVDRALVAHREYFHHTSHQETTRP